MDGELKPSHSDGCDREVSLAKLEKLTLSNSPSVAEKAEDNIGASRGDDGQEGAQVLSLSSKRQSEKEREAVGKLDPSYDLLCEDDPDDFITLEMPVDSTTTDSDALPLEVEYRRKRGSFLDSLRHNHGPGGMTRTVITGGRPRSGGFIGDKADMMKGVGGLAMLKVSNDWPILEYEADNDGSEKDVEGKTESGEAWRTGHLSISEDDIDLQRQRFMADDLVSADSMTPSHDERDATHTPRIVEHENQKEQCEEEDKEKRTAVSLLSSTHSPSQRHQCVITPGQRGTWRADVLEEEEESQGTTAGIGVTSSTNIRRSRSPAFDPSLRSDMLMSLQQMGDPEMSVHQSLHIGLAPSDLQLSKIKLPSDEQLAIEASRARIDSVGSDQREFVDEDVESSIWCEHQKHVFVLSLSGKPVYSRYGKEDKLVNLFGIMQALVSFVQDDRDNLRSIVSGKHRFVFVCRGPLVLVSVAQSRQSETQLAIQLNYVYNQILSVLTYTQLSQIFEKSPSYDLRNLLQGSEKFVDNVLNMMDKDPSFIIGGIRCLAMSLPLRHIITTTLLQCKSKDVLFAVVVANNQVVTYIKPKEHNLVPIDIHLILNLVDASTSFRSAESWTPICLPKFNDTGFLHAHVSYLRSDSPACMLLLTTNKELFFDLQECQQKIIEKLEKQGCIHQIKDTVRESDYNIDHLRVPEIHHFLYKSRKTSCVTSPQLPPIYALEEDRQRLYSVYMFMHERLHSSTWPTKILYHVGNKEALLGWRTANFDLYIIFDPLISKVQAISSGNKLIKWIIREEDKLIITSSHTF